MKLRRLLIVVGAICLLGGGALAIWIAQLDVKDVATLVERKVEQATGRTLHIDGAITLKFSLIPTLAIEGIRFQNAAWGSKPDMLSVKRAEIQLALLPLLHRQIALRKIALIEPQVLLEVNARGDKNWVFNSADQTEDPQQRKLAIDIAELTIERGVAEYRPASPAQPQIVQLDTLSLQASGGTQATIDTRLVFNQVPIELAGVIPSPTRFGTVTAPIDLKIVCGDARFTLTGELPARNATQGPSSQSVPQATPDASPFEGADLRFTAQADNPAGLAKQFQVSLPRLPKAVIEGRAHIVKSVLELNLEKFQLGNSNMRAQMQWPLVGGRTGVTANVDAPLVDLHEIFGPLVPPKAKSTNARIFSDEPLPLKALSAVDMHADIKVARLVLRDGRPLQDLAVKFDLHGGKLVADPLSLSAQGKPLHARLTADASNGRSLSADLSLEGKGIPLASLAVLANVAAVPEGAPTDLTIRFSGHGASVRQLMASGDGDVQVTIGPGKWKGHAFELGADITELFKAILPVGDTGDYTNLQCAVIRFPIKQGVAHIENGIGVETTKVKVLAFGVIDLRDETLKLGFRPKAGTGLGVGVGSFAQLVSVGGTLSKPGVEVDAVGAATTAIELGLAASTGGASLLAQRLFADNAVDHPCQTALGKNVTKGGGTKPGTTSAGQRTPSSPVDALKRLFGG